jgi:HlyD family secretion protein
MRRVVVVLVVVVTLAILAGGWWWARTSPGQVVQFLVDGGLEENRAAEFVAMVSGRTGTQEGEPLIASGTIEGETVSVVSEVGGRIVGLYAEEGEEVEGNQVLVELDTSTLLAQLQQARAVVVAAEANLASVKAGTHPAAILAAQAELNKAIAEQSAAETAWTDLQVILATPQDIEARIVEAQTDVDVAKVQIEQAEAQVKAAEVEREQYRGRGSMEEKYLYIVYDYQVRAAQAGVDLAQTRKKGAEQTLAALKAWRKQPLALAGQVHAAEGKFEMAGAAVAVAQAKLDELEAGPIAEEVAVAEAQIVQAQAAVHAIETQVEKMTLRTPIGGVVTSRSARPGEAALPGATLLTVVNLDEVKLTIYIPEGDLGRVYLGQEVEVAVDSFPGKVFTGTVSYIAQQAEFTPRNVQTEEDRVNMVFAVHVRIPNPSHLLKPGMPADAVIRQ